ncbi:MAG TPA: AAA family ATPase, partial [Thiolinea sp.]|nr:AAA family ATPase [Thiolinea sp.]
ERHRLQAGECFITAAGVRIGPGWLCVPEQPDVQGGILQRQQEIRQLQVRLQQLEPVLEQGRQTVEQHQQQILTLEQQRRQLQPEVSRLHREESVQRSELAGLTQKLEQLEQRGWQLAQEQEETRQQLRQQHIEHETATLARNRALEQLEQLEAGREQQQQAREQARQQLADLRTTLRRHQDGVHALSLALETTRTHLSHSEQQQVRLQGRLAQLQLQHAELEAQIAAADQPADSLAESLQQAREQQAELALQLQAARGQVQGLEQAIREQEQARAEAEQQSGAARDRLEQLKLERQSVQVREQGLAGQFNQTGFDHRTLLEQITAEETPAWLQQQLQDTQDRIQRLGPINLAAIGEYREQAERKQYLDQQNTDLVVALDTLESAIEKIDRETRTRFRDTFEQVNRRLGEMFPRLFGGGACHLEMTEANLLTTGITIMARPPGKRLSSIHLMSGGEKALTAVALVFAIFELNPAPFCLLDEVDAPLDEANVGRFCELVRTMSERVQFIFITHNKTTMELAENLIGVTMREPGVSRLVAVDVAEAVRLANA